MKAVRIHRFGGPDALSLDDLPVPHPQADEVVVQIHAASLNPIDSKIRSGEFPPVTQAMLPMTLGRDMAGVITAAGQSVRGLAIGDAVYAMPSWATGCYAEYALAKAHEVAPRPRRLDAAQAAAVPVAGLTAWQALFVHGELAAGQRVLIHGAAGGVGHLAVQFAKQHGATVYATASARDLDFVRGLGADVAIDYRAERFEDRAQGMDMVLDLIGGDPQDRSWSVLKPNGIIVSTLEEPKQDLARRAQARGVMCLSQPDGQQLREIGALFEAGRVRVEVTVLRGLSEAGHGQTLLESEHPRGKVVLHVAG